MIAKGLEWDAGADEAEAWFGGEHYFAELVDNGEWWANWTDSRFPTEAEAKAAAQRHADECVASMLSTGTLELLSWAHMEAPDHIGDDGVDNLHETVELIDRILTTRKETERG